MPSRWATEAPAHQRRGANTRHVRELGVVGRVGHHRCGQHAAPPEPVRDGAVLQPAELTQTRTWSSPSRSRWNSSWPATSTPSPRSAACRPGSWSTCLKSAVLQRLVGIAPVFNPKYLDFSKHWGFQISPCNIRAGNEKGRVENGVGYVKKNLPAGLALPDFAAMQPRAATWVNTVADVRIHATTRERPIDRFEGERAHLRRLNPAGYDLARICQVRATKQFRVPLDSNHYTVPSRYAGLPLTLKAHADRVCASMTANNS